MIYNNIAWKKEELYEMSAESSQVRHNCVTREFFKRRSRERHTDMYNNSWWHKTSSATNRYHSTRYVQMSWQAGMLTRPEIDEAKAEANSHEAEAKSALIFSAKFYILTQFFVQKNTNFPSIFDGNSKSSAQNGL